MLVYFKNNNNEWIDFSDRYIKLSNISHKAGDAIINSAFSTSISSIVMDNSDSFWDNPNNWNNNWNMSKNNSEVVLKGVDVFLREKTIDKGKISINSLGIFKIESFSTKGGKATLKLNSLSQWINKENKKADRVKNGHVWHQSRAVSFLISELLKLEFSSDDVTGSIVSSNSSSNEIELDTFVPKWSEGAQINNTTTNTSYIVYGRVDDTTIKVNVLDSSDSFDWSAGNNYKLKGEDNLPDSYVIPDRLVIPTYDNIRVFSSLGKTPTNVKNNFYSEV